MEIFYTNKKGVVFDTNLENINRNKLTWIRLVGRDDEIKAISDFSKIPIQEFDEFFEQDERSRLRHANKYLELIYQEPFTENGEIMTTPVKMFITNNLIITVSKEKTKLGVKIANLMKQKKLKFMFNYSIGRLLYNFLDKINDEFLLTIDKIANLADVLESKEGNVSSEQLMKLYNSNVTLTHFNQALIANLEVLIALKKSYFRGFTKDDLDLFSELYYDKLQILDTEKVQREVVTNLFNFQTVVATQKLNNFMKRLTTLALIFVVPTLITGFFGMNVNVPFGSHKYGFIIVLLMIMALVGGMLFMFKKLDWL